MEKIKWLLVGTGDIANKRVAPALSEAENSELTAVCDIRKENAESLAANFNVANVFDNYEEALSETNADAVYLATPVCLHTPQAVTAIKAGKHVLIEKPLAVKTEDCRELLSITENSPQKAGCSYFRRCTPRYLYTKNMLESGEFGQVVSIRMTYFSWFSPTADDPKYWRVVKEKSGGGPLSDMGTHMFDVLVGLFGMPKTVYAKCANLVNSWNVEDSAAIIMTLENGAQVTASFNWNSKTWRHEFEIIGTEAKIDWLPYDTGPVTKTVGRNIENLELPGHENVHFPLVQDFVEAIINDRKPVCPVSEACKTNQLLDAVYQSAEKNQEVVVSGS